ncbi:FAD-binding domain-containing protein [Byssothecium circinans]|uniref:FAD-binding domain-containing protein n=1 Tax=Byssothecium circinans TaxID=147558 RepID=A0A6A5TDQ2_9PLEO|nr:FAD-binding domain-containing protein [Byssothecium circinans]
MLYSVLAAAAALPALGFALALAQSQELSFTNQLLETVDALHSTDPLILELRASIEDATRALNNIISITPRDPSQAAVSSQRACKILKLILPNYYTDPTNQSAYNVLRTKNWSSNCDLPAACFITPVHSAQVAVTLQIINCTQSKFAVRSGGHNPNPGFAGVGEQGVTIDTQGFTTLGLSADKSIATVGAGLRFGPVQTFLDQNGVAVVSGRNKDVGTGLLLGGGHPIINSLTGLAADAIESAEVVLSNFRVVNASRTVNPDLFRALKGGGNNFGIITKFELKTTMPRNIWYRNVVYSNSNPRAVFEALVKVQENMEADDKAGIQMTCSPAGFTVAFVYGEHTNDPEVFAPFRSLNSTAVTIPPTNGTALGFINALSPPQAEASRDTVGITTYLDTDLYVDIYSRYLTAASQNGNPTTVFLLPIQTFGAAATQIAEQNGGNVLGITAKPQTWWNPIAQWTNPADDARVHETLLNLAASIKSAAQAKSLDDKFIFPNIASRDQDVLASFGEQNLESLRAVSREYDVLGMFQNLQNGGFLVSNA